MKYRTYAELAQSTRYEAIDSNLLRAYYGNCFTIDLPVSGYKMFNPNKIADVEFYPPATKMTFTDGSVVTATAREGDSFSPETGMMVCIMKYIFGDQKYNNMFRKWIKKDKQRKEEKVKAEEKAKKEKEIKKRQAEKERRRRIARAERAKEREIEIQKEAYLRAMKELGD